MSAAFKAQIKSTPKLVLLALCDCANDQGECYPSIPTLMEKCSAGERTVQDAVAMLERDGFIRRDFRNGRSTVYWVNDPRSWRTPAAAAPPQQPHPTPAVPAPQPPQTAHPTPANGAPRTITEPSVEPSLKQKAAAVLPQPQAPLPLPPFDGENFEAIPAKALVPLGKAWELPESWGVDAEALGWKPGEVLKESEKFRQFFVSGKGAGKRRSLKGWRQSWSNWLGNAERYGVR